jgi:hypothetical protein
MTLASEGVLIAIQSRQKALSSLSELLMGGSVTYRGTADVPDGLVLAVPRRTHNPPPPGGYGTDGYRRLPQ